MNSYFQVALIVFVFYIGILAYSAALKYDVLSRVERRDWEAPFPYSDGDMLEFSMPYIAGVVVAAILAVMWPATLPMFVVGGLVFAVVLRIKGKKKNEIKSC